MVKRSVAAAALAVPTVVAAFLTANPAQGSAARDTIAHSRPSWLGHAHFLGAAAQSASVSGRVYLTPNGGLAALERAALAVSTPGSAQYGHFLSPAQFFTKFGTRTAAVNQVRQWLTSSGLRVTGVAAHNRYVTIKGTVGAAEKAFGVQIDRYRHAGYTVQAPSGALTAPAGVASSVLAVSGLDTTPNMAKPLTQKPAPPPAGFRNGRPCSAYYGEKLASDQPQFDGATLPYAICGYVGAQFRSAYEGGTTLDGSGVTVAIIDAYASPTLASDTATYASRNGDRSYADGQFSESLPQTFTRGNTGPRQCDASGWYAEQSLDVEAVHAMAQGADIRYYAAASCYDSDLLDALARVNDDDVAQVVSNSWGQTGEVVKSSTVAAYDAVFSQASLEGISVMFSSGDNGDEAATTGTVQPDFPASDPLVTAVGGTATAINGSGSLAWETGWGTVKYSKSSDGTTWNQVGFLYGAGGGISTVFGQPSYQAGITPAGGRGVPDVAMDADVTTGMLIGLTQAFPDGVYYDQYRIGGTSLASPLFAGMTALSLQHAGHGAGLLNPTIYSHQGAFTDVTGDGPDAGNVRVDYANGVDASGGLLYSVRTFNQDSSLTVASGWDDVTGVGSANAGWLMALG